MSSGWENWVCGMRVALVLCAAALVCLAFPPAVSRAATAEVAKDATVDYRAADGESNRVVLSQLDRLTIRVTDSGAVIRPGRGCRSVDAHTVDCSFVNPSDSDALFRANVQAGDMDDLVDGQGPGLSANGGAGNDTLQSSSDLPGTLNGGGGHDTLRAGRYQSTLIDGDTSGSADRDVFDGRGGDAVVSYASRTARVKVDLGHPGRNGEVGERDVIRSVRAVIGGRGADVLRGTNRGDMLEGGPGRDRLYGRAGADGLYGGGGADRLVGEAGADSIGGAEGSDVVRGGADNDRLDGGPGHDRLHGGRGDDNLSSGSALCGLGVDTVRPSANDFVGTDCETAQFNLPAAVGENAGIFVEPNPYGDGRTALTFRVQCPFYEYSGDRTSLRGALRGVVRITARDGRLLGTGRLMPAGRLCATQVGGEEAGPIPWVRIRLTLSPAGRSLVKLSRRPVVRVKFSGGPNVPPVPWTIRFGGK